MVQFLITNLYFLTMKRYYLTALLLLLLGSWWTWFSRVPASAMETTLGVEAAIGQRAPDFALETLDGETFTLSEALADGSPVVLNFLGDVVSALRAGAARAAKHGSALR